MPIKSNNHHINQSHQHRIEIKPPKNRLQECTFFSKSFFSKHHSWNLARANPQNFHLTYPCFWTLPEQITPRMCANPEPMLQRHTTKPQTLRFSSHTSLFWTLPEQLSILHHACVPTHPEDTPQNLRPQDFHLTHPSFELCRSSSPCYTTHVCNVPKIHHKTSDPKIFISHIPVSNFAWTTRNRWHHACVPTHPEDTRQNLRP